jgi:uncharacterized protein involved in outer membrane biogenesis
MILKKLMKILGWVTGSVLVLVILLVVGLRLFLPADKLRDLAVARASATMGREVTVKDVRVSLRGGLGIQLTGVGIGNPEGFPAGHLMKAESVDLKLRLRPLFSRQVHADRLVINSPDISLVKFGAERNNFTFTASKSDQPATGGDSGESSGKSSGTTLNLEQFQCNGGTLSFSDEETGTGLSLTGLRLNWNVTDSGGGLLVSHGKTGADSLKISGNQAFSLGPVTLDHKASVHQGQKRFTLEQGQCALAGLDFTVTSEVIYDPDAAVTRAEVIGETLDLATVLSLVPAKNAQALKGLEAKGSLDLRTLITFDQKKDDPLIVEGSIELTGGRLETPDIPEPITNLTAAADFDLDALHMTSCKAKLSGVDLEYSGMVTGLKQPADARTEGILNVVADLASLQGYLPAERKAVLAGKASGWAKVAGRMENPRDLFVGGEITIIDLSYRDANIFEPVTDLDATVTLGPRDATIKNLAVKLQPSNFTLNGVVRNLVPSLLAKSAADLHLDFTLNSPLFNVDNLFPAASPGAAAPATAAGAPRPPVLQEFPSFQGSGKVAITNLIYGGVTFTDITGKVAIADRTVKVSEATGGVFSGQITGQTTVDLKNMNTPGYRGKFAARGIQADSLLTRFTPLKGHIQGALDFSGTFTAAGKDPAVVRRSLALDAQSAMTQGRLVTSGVIQQGMNTLATKLGRTFDKEEKLKDVAASVKVAGERLILDRFSSEVPGLGTLSIGGSYGFTGDLDFRGDLLLTEENSRKLLGSSSGGLTSAIGKFFGKEDQDAVPRLSLPVKIGGAFTRPQVALDFSGVASSAGQEVVDELKGELEGLFRK